jgi:hypothetical protein
MAQPVWVTPAGNLGTIPEGVFYSTPLLAYEPDTASTVYYSLIAGALPAGIQIQETGVIAGVPKSSATVQGVPSSVIKDVTSKFAIRAYTKKTVNNITVINRLADRTFELTVTNTAVPEFITPAGQITQYYDGGLVNGFQIEYLDIDTNAVVRLISGALPPGLTISATGLISGIIPPLKEDTNYSFTLEITNGAVGGSNTRSFSIFVYTRMIMTADTTRITADNNFVTADNYPTYIPFITNPQGSIGITQSDNWFAYQFEAIDFSNDQYQFELVTNSQTPSPLTSAGLTLDSNTGWLYGYIPDLGINDVVYSFGIRVFKKDDPYFISDEYSYSLEIVGPISSQIRWLTPSNLGTIDNGSTSTFYVKAVATSGASLQYRLLSGSNSNLPQGLQLLPSGEIAGRVSFNTFALDLGTTTFDVNYLDHPTTFDMKHTFTVNAHSVSDYISVNKTFSITVTRTYNEPYENLYIQAMPPENDRQLINSLLQNQDIFQQNFIYRPSDPNFGVATGVVYNHAYGLTASTLTDYVNSLKINHYWKNLVLGEIKTAQAIDSSGNVVYEVVYSEVIDNLVNSQGQSVSKQVTLPYPVVNDDSSETSTVYPNSLINMRDQVIDSVGQISTVLPLWMTSKQSNGRVLGFTPCWVIAYAKPGYSKQIAYYINEKFGIKLNLIDYEVDRYELDRLLSHNWDPVADSSHGAWEPTPASTRFDDGGTGFVDYWYNNNGDYVNWNNVDSEPVTWTNDYNGKPTIFDGGSLQFIAPVDMYSHTQAYDKYLLFPRRNILSNPG